MAVDVLRLTPTANAIVSDDAKIAVLA